MNRLPKERIYVTRCPQCGSLIMLSGDELLQCWEPKPTTNHCYKYKCPGCGNRTSHTTTELLMSNDNVQYTVDWDDYIHAMNRSLGHGIIIEEGDRANEHW